MDFRKIGTGMEDTDWINLAQDKDQWRAVLNTLIYLLVPKKAGNVLASLETARF
jgi:hypothetical protein